MAGSFLDLGRRLERGIFIATLMEAVLRSGPGLNVLLEPALEIADSVMTHRRRYFSEPRLASMMEVLVQDPANPRSLAFQIASLKEHAARAAHWRRTPKAWRRCESLVGQIDASSGQRSAEPEPATPRRPENWCPALVDEIAGRLAELSESAHAGLFQPRHAAGELT